MHHNAVVDKEQYDEIVNAYMEQGKQLIALQNLHDSVTNERDSWKHAYLRAKDSHDAELEKLRKENENIRNNLRDKRERVFDMTVENEKLRLEKDSLTQDNSSLRAERDEAYKQVNSLRNERDRAYEDATRQREDYANLTDKCAKLKKMGEDFCIEACELSSALRARNALLQILFLATGINKEMLKDMFNCHFHTPDASFDEDLARRMVQYCINNNSTIIDTLTGYRFDIADRLAKAIKVRDVYGTPRKQGNDVRAKPEQSQRRAKRGKAKPHQKEK